VRKVTIASALTLIFTLGPVPVLLSLSSAGTAPPPAYPGYAPPATDFIYPVGAARVAPTSAADSPNGYRIEQTFNNSCDPSLKEGYYSGGQYFCGHTGVDLVNLGGADDVVHATANGLVAEVGYVGAMGEMVRLQHLLPDGTYIYSLYQHMAMGSLRVARGDIVTMGLALSNEGKPVPSQVVNPSSLIPKGAKNVTVATRLAASTVSRVSVARLPTCRLTPSRLRCGVTSKASSEIRVRCSSSSQSVRPIGLEKRSVYAWRPSAFSMRLSARMRSGPR